MCVQVTVLKAVKLLCTACKSSLMKLDQSIHDKVS